jgi:hypothetical protein
MSSGFDDRVEARLIGLRMATDAPNGLNAIVTNLSLSDGTSPSQQTDYRNSLSNQSITSSTYNSLSSNGSSSNNAPVTARR